MFGRMIAIGTRLINGDALCPSRRSILSRSAAAAPDANLSADN